MTGCCARCRQPGRLDTIPSLDHPRVCVACAIEFWRTVLDIVRARRVVAAEVVVEIAPAVQFLAAPVPDGPRQTKVRRAPRTTWYNQSNPVRLSR